MNKFIAFCIVFLFFINYTFAQTDITGNITANTTWSAGTYRIGFGANPDNINITNGATLTIEPGVTVLLDEDARITVGPAVSGGRLDAIGSAASPIVFTRTAAGVRHWGIRFARYADDNSQLNYCIIEYGLADGGYPDLHGGGILIYDSSPTVQNSIIRYCRANRNGGAIYVGAENDVANPMILYNSIYQDSSGAAGSYDAGGIAIASALDNSSPTIIGNTIENCYSTDGGGGIWLEAGIGVNNSIIEENVIRNNDAFTFGGGIQVEDVGGGAPSISRNLIEGNDAGVNGGGIYVDAGDNPDISANLILNNSAGTGGGVYASGSMANFYNNTVYGNSATANGGLRVTATDTVINSIIYNNGATPITAGSPVSFCCVEGGYAGGSGIVTANPQFIDQANGDYHLAYNSPCIDAGATGGAIVDYDGNATNKDGNNNGTSGFDIGAFEFLQAANEFNESSGTVTFNSDTYEAGATNPVAQITLNSPSITAGNADSIIVDVFTKSIPYNATVGSKSVLRWIEIVRQTDVTFTSANLRIYYGQSEFDKSNLSNEGNLSIFWYNEPGGYWQNLGVDAGSIVDNYIQVNALPQSYFSNSYATSYFALADISDEPLPVTLLSFIAKYADSGINLKWETSSEQNNMGFELFRSVDGSAFELISSYNTNEGLEGLGNSSVGKSYQYQDRDILINKKYNYQLYNVDYSGFKNEVGQIQVTTTETTQDPLTVGEFKLLGNYPNPFNSQTKIKFNLPEEARIKICIYDVRGRQIKELLLENGKAGENSILFSSEGLASGLYFYEVSANINTGKFYSSYGRMLYVK